MKKHRFYISLTLIVTLLGLLFFYPLPATVVGPSLVELRTGTAQQVFVPDLRGGNQLIDIRVVPEQQVEAGDVIAVLRNVQLLMELAEAEGRYLELKQELETLRTMVIHGRDTATRIPPVEEMYAVARELLRNKQRDVDSLTLRAPMAGTVVSPPWRIYQPSPDGQLSAWWGSPLERENLNATLEPGTVVCSVGDPRYLEAVIIVAQSRMPFLELGQRVEMILDEFPWVTYHGVVEEIERTAITSLELQLSTNYGGEIPTTRNLAGAEEPNRASYRIRMELDNQDDLSIRVGMTGVGKIHIQPQSLGYRLWLFVSETFNFKM